MPEFLRQMLTEANNSTYSLVRVLAALAVLVALVLEVYAVVSAKHFDLQAYGIGMGAVFASFGAALKLGADTENKG